MILIETQVLERVNGMQLAWMTDIHLNFVGTQHIEAFLNRVQTLSVDAVLITGDIGEASSMGDYLQRIAAHLKRPIYFILGNHDYYYGSIANVRAQARRLSQTNPLLHWLPEVGVIPLSDHGALVGHGGWADGGYGNFLASPVVLNDYKLIAELALLPDRPALLGALQRLGNAGAQTLRKHLQQALAQYPRVLVALHAPPFQETCWHEGRTPDDSDPYLPHFTCKACGDVLRELATTHPDKELLVLCGHTHGSGDVQVLPNLRVITGGAVYEHPVVQRVLRISEQGFAEL